LIQSAQNNTVLQKHSFYKSYIGYNWSTNNGTYRSQSKPFLLWHYDANIKNTAVNKSETETLQSERQTLPMMSPQG